MYGKRKIYVTVSLVWKEERERGREEEREREREREMGNEKNGRQRDERVEDWRVLGGSA